MASQDNDPRNICHECINDEYLKKEVSEKGTMLPCHCCGDTHKALTFGEMADRIHETLNLHYAPVPIDPVEPWGYFLQKEGLWDRSGDPIDIVIADMVGIDEDLALDLVSVLSDMHGAYWDAKAGEEDPYGSEAHYEEHDPDDLAFRETWANFVTDIQSHARFFSPNAEKMLDFIFEDLKLSQRRHGDSLIREIGPDDQDKFVWRARVAQAQEELKEILRSPTSELGPPPSRLARAGRMNAQGISVLYGAEDKETCIAEVRAPVGSHVAVGKFEITRTVRLLDMDALANTFVKGSCFDPEYATRMGRAAFLRQLASEISLPVMPRDEDVEYLPTQAVAEYLANRVCPRLDGIIFRSTQTGGEGRNLVLFNHASGVEQPDQSHINSVEVHILPTAYDIDKDEDDSISIYEILADDKDHTNPIPPSSTPIRFGYGDENGDEYLLRSEPTLKMVLGYPEVVKIRRVNYDSRSLYVTRHPNFKPFTDDDSAPF